MKTLMRALVLAGILLAAIGSYSFGTSTGLFTFIILGFALECAFWFGIFPVKRKRNPTRKSAANT